MLYTRENEIQLSESEFWFEFVPNILTTLMLVTLWCWQIKDVGDKIIKFVPFLSLYLWFLVDQIRHQLSEIGH